jgi:sodium transport system permease protein
MSLRNVGIVYRKELTDSLRDRRTLISMILVPLLIFPVLMLGFGFMAEQLVGKAKREPSKVMVLGGEDSPRALEQLRQLSTIRIVPSSPDYADLISNRQIRAAVEIPAGFQAALDRGEPSKILIYDYEGDIKSSIAAGRLEKFFRDLRDQTTRERLQARNLPDTLLSPFKIEQKNVASPEKVWGALFGGLIGYMVILLCMTGAMYPAMDLTAGEKERGTMETILCSPVARTHLVLGKFLMVLTASLSTALLSVISMGVSFWGMGKITPAEASRSGPQFAMSINPKAIIAVFCMALPVAVLFSATLFTIALFAKSYREAQSYLTPMTFVVIIPAVASLLPGVELNLKLALVPILNTSLVSKEIITGTFHWNYIAMIFASSSVYAAIAIFVAVKMFQREDVLFRS